MTELLPHIGPGFINSFGNAIEFIFEPRESRGGGTDVGGLSQVGAPQRPPPKGNQQAPPMSAASRRCSS